MWGHLRFGRPFRKGVWNSDTIGQRRGIKSLKFYGCPLWMTPQLVWVFARHFHMGFSSSINGIFLIASYIAFGLLGWTFTRVSLSTYVQTLHGLKLIWCKYYSDNWNCIKIHIINIVFKDFLLLQRSLMITAIQCCNLKFCLFICIYNLIWR